MCVSPGVFYLCVYLIVTVVVVVVVCFSQGVINLESLGKRGYRVPPSGTIQVVRKPSVFHICGFI